MVVVNGAVINVVEAQIKNDNRLLTWVAIAAVSPGGVTARVLVRCRKDQIQTHQGQGCRACTPTSPSHSRTNASSADADGDKEANGPKHNIS